MASIGGLDSCPSNVFGVTGNQCTIVTVDGQPYDPSPCTTSASACGGEIESGAPGAIGNVAVGDFFWLNYLGTEAMRLIAIDPSNPLKWTFQRGFNGVVSTSGPDPQLVTDCNADPNPANPNLGSEWYWNYASDPHGTGTTTILDDPNGIGAHFFIQNGEMVNSYTFDPRCTAPNLCYQNREFTSIPQLVSEGATGSDPYNKWF